MRDKSYGQSQKPSLFDRFGVYLSERRIARELRGGKHFLDFGAGFLQIWLKFIGNLS